VPPVSEKSRTFSRAFAPVPVFCPKIYGERQFAAHLVRGGERGRAKDGAVPIDVGGVAMRTVSLSRWWAREEAEEVEGRFIGVRGWGHCWVVCMIYRHMDGGVEGELGRVNTRGNATCMRLAAGGGVLLARMKREQARGLPGKRISHTR